MFNFEAGDALGMNTAAAVIIIAVCFRKRRAVGVSGNQDMIFLLCPMLEMLFGSALAFIVLGGTGGVENTEAF